MLENRHAGVTKIARKLNIGREAARWILTNNLDMRRVNARLVPKELNFLQEVVKDLKPQKLI